VSIQRVKVISLLSITNPVPLNKKSIAYTTDTPTIQLAKSNRAVKQVLTNTSIEGVPELLSNNLNLTGEEVIFDINEILSRAERVSTVTDINKVIQDLTRAEHKVYKEINTTLTSIANSNGIDGNVNIFKLGEELQSRK